MGDSFIFDDKYSMLCLFIERNLFFHTMFTHVVGGKENIMILFRVMSVMA